MRILMLILLDVLIWACGALFGWCLARRQMVKRARRALHAIPPSRVRDEIRAARWN